MRTEAEIHEHRAQLGQRIRELRTRLDELEDHQGTETEAGREFDDVAYDASRLERDSNMLDWVLGEEH